MPKSTEPLKYRGHTIVSKGGEHWQARGLLGKKIVVDTVSGDTFDEVVSAVKEAIDAIFAAERAARGSTDVPTADWFRKAFSQVSMSAGQSAMIDAHLRAPDNVLTTRQLAEAARYDDWTGVNMHYGLLGRAVAEIMEWEPDVKNDDGSTVWTFTLATGWWEEDEDGKHWRWKLRPQVVEALSMPN